MVRSGSYNIVMMRRLMRYAKNVNGTNAFWYGATILKQGAKNLSLVTNASEKISNFDPLAVF